MTKEAPAVIGLEGMKGLDQGGLKVFERAGGSLAQVGLEFGEGLLDGIEVGTIGRQVPISLCLEHQLLPPAPMKLAASHGLTLSVHINILEPAQKLVPIHTH